MGAAAAWAVPLAVGVASTAAQSMSGGKSRKSPIEKDLKLTAQQALGEMRQSDFFGAKNVAGAGSQGLLDLLGSASGPLKDLITTGSPVDQSGAVQSTETLAKRNIEDQAKALQEQFASTGVRSGSDVMRSSALLRERGTQDLNDQILKMVTASQEAARGRQVQSIGVGQNLYEGAYSAGLAPLQAASGYQIPQRAPAPGAQALSQITPALLYSLSQANYSGGKGQAGTPATA